MRVLACRGGGMTTVGGGVVLIPTNTQKWFFDRES